MKSNKNVEIEKIYKKMVDEARDVMFGYWKKYRIMRANPDAGFMLREVQIIYDNLNSQSEFLRNVIKKVQDEKTI